MDMAVTLKREEGGDWNKSTQISREAWGERYEHICISREYQPNRIESTSGESTSQTALSYLAYV